MENIKIEFETVNSAFEDAPEIEVARILRELAHQIESGYRPSSLRDINGNKVGIVEYE